ncbi:hypothetical protein QCA50_008138 [Cerrena zonata]|uniref:Uncharacterized protein n=1 Tax=Cerrena zonata TaxID=2478898 RepID=A0AAW0GI15_9APHY
MATSVDMGFGENANLVSATAIFDRIVSGRDNYGAIKDHLSRVRPKLIPLSQSKFWPRADSKNARLGGE